MNGNYLAHYLKRENNNFDLLRLFIALLVIVFHAPTLSQNPSFWLTSPILNLGGIAVGFFFFLSGLVVTNSFLSRSSFIYYTTSRIFRIWPALITVILVSALVIGPLVTNLPLSEYFTEQMTRQYIHFNLKVETRFLLPGVFDNNQLNQGVNGSLWTIRWEVKAYFLLLLLLYPFARKHKSINIFILIIFLIGLLSGLVEQFLIHLPHSSWLPLSKKDLLLGDEVHPVWFAAKPHFTLFFVGALFCILKDKIKITRWTFLFSFIGYLITFYLIAQNMWLAEQLNVSPALFTQYSIFIQFFFFSTLLAHIAFIPQFVQFKPPSDVSYGVYIWAFPLAQIVEFYFPNLNLWSNIIIVGALSVFVGYLSWHYIEHPALNLGKRVSNRVDLSYHKIKNFIINGIKQRRKI